MYSILVFTKNPKVCSMVLGFVFRFCCCPFGRALRGCSTERRVRAAKFEAVGGVSRGLAWDVEAWHYFCINFLRYGTGFISDRKIVENRNGSGSDVPSETLRHIPLMAVKFGSTDSPLSGAYPLQVLALSVPSEARTRGGRQVLCAKTFFFFCRQRTERTHRYWRHSARGCLYDEGQTCFVFCFPIP